MLRSLLAEGFKLVVHFETREVPALALTLAKPGKTGPKLHPHSEGPPCPDVVATPPRPGAPTAATARGVFLANRDSPQIGNQLSSAWLAGARDTTMPLLAELIYRWGVRTGDVDKPVVDQTGLTGNFDFTLEHTPEFVRARGEAQGVSFRDAVRQQLGLRLTRSKAPVTGACSRSCRETIGELTVSVQEARVRRRKVRHIREDRMDICRNYSEPFGHRGGILIHRDGRHHRPALVGVVRTWPEAVGTTGAS